LRRLAEELALVSIDKTPDGVAIKFSEKARISPEKLGNYVVEHKGAVFTPNGVLRLVLTEDEQDNVLDCNARRVAPASRYRLDYKM
jgi:hypothetical protein